MALVHSCFLLKKCQYCNMKITENIKYCSLTQQQNCIITIYINKIYFYHTNSALFNRFNTICEFSYNTISNNHYFTKQYKESNVTTACSPVIVLLLCRILVSSTFSLTLRLFERCHLLVLFLFSVLQ